MLGKIIFNPFFWLFFITIIAFVLVSCGFYKILENLRQEYHNETQALHELINKQTKKQKESQPHETPNAPLPPPPFVDNQDDQSMTSEDYVNLMQDIQKLNGVQEDEIENEDEDEDEDQAEAEAEAENEMVETSVEPPQKNLLELSDSELSKIKYDGLRTFLKGKNESSKGTKAELIQRIKALK